MSDNASQPVQPDEPARDGSVQPSAEEPKKKLPIGCLALIAVPVLFIGYCTVAGHTSDGGSDSDPSAYVKVACRGWVKGQLKAPSGADFSGESVTPNGGGQYTVTGYVDAQNSFGAKIRAPFTCVATYSGESTRLVSVQVDG
jgi:hypothetical protein